MRVSSQGMSNAANCNGNGSNTLHLSQSQMQQHCSHLGEGMPREKKRQLYKNKPIRSDKQQDVHCTYNVTKMRVRTTIVAVGKQYYIFSECVCSRRCAACNAHAPYCRLWCVRLYSIFPQYPIKGTRLKKKMRVLIFSTSV